MRDVILIVPANFELDSMMGSMSGWADAALDSLEQRLIIRLANGKAVELARDDSVSEHYDEPDEIESIKVMGASPRFFLVHFRDVDALRDVLMRVADRVDVLIDNDFGLIEAGDRFVKRWRLNPDWDWL